MEKVVNNSKFDQMLCICDIFFAFLLTAVYHAIRGGRQMPLLVIAILAVLIVAFALHVYLLIRNKERLRTSITGCEVLLFIGIVLIRIPLFTHIQKWDSGVYYGAVTTAARSFDFGIHTILDTFRIAGHPTYAFSFFMIIGEFITPGDSIGACAVAAVMSAFAGVCLYRILDMLPIEADRRAKMVLAILLQFVPLYWGTSCYINVDYLYVLFFIYMWYAHLKKESILTCSWMAMIMFTKETGWMIVAGYVLGYLLRMLIEHRQDSAKDTIKAFLRDPFVRILLVCGVMVIAYVLYQGSLFAWSDVSKGHEWIVSAQQVAEKGTGINSFGFYPPYFLNRLGQFFACNFNYIAAVGIIGIAVYRIIRKNVNGELAIKLIPLLGAMTLYVIFGATYITFALNRYNVYIHLMLWMLFGILILDSIDGICLSKVVLPIGVIMSALLAVQTFYFIDPVSNLLYTRLDTGRGPILATAYGLSYYGDPLVNNYRYAYTIDLMDDMLREAGYDADMQIVKWDSDVDQCYMDICGKHDLAWDSKHERRVIYTEDMLGNPSIIKLNMLDQAESDGTTMTESYADRILVYFIPYNDQNQQECLAQFVDRYDISNKQEIINWGGRIDYYILTMK